jgi:hypothetical protein
MMRQYHVLVRLREIATQRLAIEVRHAIVNSTLSFPL